MTLFLLHSDTVRYRIVECQIIDQRSWNTLPRVSQRRKNGRTEADHR